MAGTDRESCLSFILAESEFREELHTQLLDMMYTTVWRFAACKETRAAAITAFLNDLVAQRVAQRSDSKQRLRRTR